MVGGGLAGMTAALSIAEQGYDVHLVEREEQLGGNLRHIYTQLRIGDCGSEILSHKLLTRKNCWLA